MGKKFVSFYDRHATRMRRRLAFSLATFGMLALLVVSGAYASGQKQTAKASATLKPITLTYASFAAAASPYSKAFRYVANQLKKETNGRVTFREHYSSSLVGFNQMISALQTGRADVTIFLPVQNPRKFPLSSVSSVPFSAFNTWANSEAFDHMYKADPQFAAEWKAQKIVPLWFSSIGPAVLGSRQPMPTLASLKNKSIRATGYLVQALQAVGADPVAMPNSNVYEALQRGVIQAFYASTLDGAAIDNRNFEVTKYWYDLGAGEYAMLVTAMSQSAFDKLTKPEQKDLFNAIDSIRKVFWTQYYYPLMKVACNNAYNGGLKSIELWPKSQAAAFRKAAAPVVRAKWFSDVKAAGISHAEAEKFFTNYLQTVRHYEAIVPKPFAESATQLCTAQFKADGRP